MQPILQNLIILNLIHLIQCDGYMAVCYVLVIGELTSLAHSTLYNC
jgi:hypothetical protein